MVTGLGEVFLRSAEGSFIQVTVFVGAVLLLFGYIDYKQQGLFIETIARSKKYQPLIGSLLGIIPGCGGSILVMPLYVKGKVTFGTVIATTIATAGDSAFVTLTKAPRQFAFITLISLFIGTLCGYAVDYLKLGDLIKRKVSRQKNEDLALRHKEAEKYMDTIYGPDTSLSRSCNLRHIGHEEGDEIDMALHHTKPLDPKSMGYKITHTCYVIFWSVIFIGFILGILDLFQVDLNKFWGTRKLGRLVGLLGTLVTVMYMTCSRRLIKAQTHEDVEHKLFSLQETLIHNAKETAFVGTWVFAAYFIYELSIAFLGGEQVLATMLVASGFAAVILGVMVGMIPGCGPQIIFVSLYLKGMFPFSALLANAISQDGDALFPLIALDRRAAFWTTIINTFIAFFVGTLAYYIENGLA